MLLQREPGARPPTAQTGLHPPWLQSTGSWTDRPAGDDQMTSILGVDNPFYCSPSGLAFIMPSSVMTACHGLALLHGHAGQLVCRGWTCLNLCDGSVVTKYSHACFHLSSPQTICLPSTLSFPRLIAPALEDMDSVFNSTWCL